MSLPAASALVVSALVASEAAGVLPSVVEGAGGAGANGAGVVGPGGSGGGGSSVSSP